MLKELTPKQVCIMRRVSFSEASTTPNALKIHGTPSSANIVHAPHRRLK